MISTLSNLVGNHIRLTKNRPLARHGRRPALFHIPLLPSYLTFPNNQTEPKTSELWVRVQYRGISNGWVLTANKRGPILLPAEGSPATAAKEFQNQEAAAAAAAAAALKAAEPVEDEDSPADSKGGKGRDQNRALTAANGAKGGAPAPAPAAGGGGKAAGVSAGQFMTSAG